MNGTQSFRFRHYASIVVQTGVLFAIASTAWSQTATQNLTIGFVTSGAGVSPVGLPLSNWASAAIAILICVAAFVMLRRRNLRGGRFLSAWLAFASGAMMFGIVGQGVIDEAAAQGPVTIIDLSISPTVNVGAFYPNLAVTAVVNNTTGQTVQITSITLGAGPYVNSGPNTCAIATVLAPGATCSINLSAQLS